MKLKDNKDQSVIRNWIDSPFKELLNKYMRLVMSEENVSYLTNVNDGWKSDAPKFTDEEIEVLTEIEKEIIKEHYEH